MSYSANQYNYATPLSSVASFIDDAYALDGNYFILGNNVLDGSYNVVSGNVGLWSSGIPLSDGTLPTPFVLTIEEPLVATFVRVVGSSNGYPVDFTIELYSDAELIHSVSVSSNSKSEYIEQLPGRMSFTKCVITITKTSNAGSPVRLLNIYPLPYLSSSDSLLVTTSDRSNVIDLIELGLRDTLSISSIENVHNVSNIIDTTSDTLSIITKEFSYLNNVHSIMKSPFRKIFGKVYITYTDPMLEVETLISSESQAYNSDYAQIVDGNREAEHVYFTLYDNDLTGAYVLSDASSQVGWVSSIISDENGFFETDPFIKLSFSARPVLALEITFDNSHNSLVRDFTVKFVKEDGSTEDYEFTDNEDTSVSVVSTSATSDDGIPDITSVIISIHRVARPFSPAAILEIPVSSTILYKGYEDESNVISIDLLEELTYEDEIEALGGISANEVTVVLDNSSKDFYFNSGSVVSGQLKRNRKIVPWLGVEVTPGEIEWYTLGTFWSHKWEVPANGLTATVVGFDTLGLLDLTTYTNHVVQINRSLGWLLEYVLNDAKVQFPFIEYVIDEALYEIIIPYAWFDYKSHTTALRKISLCYPMHVYCDRNGRICAMTQKLKLDYYYDTWSDSTNVLDKRYSSLYTALPNIVNITVNAPTIVSNEQLVKDEVPFEASVNNVRILLFNRPYVSDLSIAIDSDVGVGYTYEVYSWGINLYFTGTGTVRSIVCKGSCIDISNQSTITRRDADSVRLNGAVTRDIQADFIQSISLANLIMDRLFALSDNDKYDATVDYRGDIALTINDPILLQNGIAPDNRYNIKRHQLSWNGSLTGTADLNT